MIKNGFDRSKLHVIHNSLDYDKQIVLRNKMKSTGLYKEHFSNDYPILCFIGRLTAVKKLEQVLEALDILNKLGKFFNLVLIGNGSEKKSLMEKSETCIWIIKSGFMGRAMMKHLMLV